MSSEFSIAYIEWAAFAFFLVPSMSHCCYKAGRQDLQEGKIAMMVDS